MTEQILSGGNTHGAVVRVGDTVRRPVGPWTPSVHALLAHLAGAGFDGAPRVLGIDDAGREILTYVDGEVVQDHRALIASDEALAEVVRTIRAFHDAAATFTHDGHAWWDLARDPSGATEILCHNDLAPWNLIRTARGWAFIDWDLAAPGRLAWDLGWALLSLVPFLADVPAEDATLLRRIAVFRDAYGGLPPDVVDVARERAAHEAATIRERAARGEAPWTRLLAEGHADVWEATADRTAANAARWSAVAR